MDPMYEAVFAIVKQIPPGRFTTYGAIAKAIGLPNGARLVGRAMGHYDGPGPWPAHRVLGAGGRLTGRFGFSPEGRMQELLEQEGLEVSNHKVRRDKDYFWDPMELGDGV